MPKVRTAPRHTRKGVEKHRHAFNPRLKGGNRSTVKIPAKSTSFHKDALLHHPTFENEPEQLNEKETRFEPNDGLRG